MVLLPAPAGPSMAMISLRGWEAVMGKAVDCTWRAGCVGMVRPRGELRNHVERNIACQRAGVVVTATEPVVAPAGYCGLRQHDERPSGSLRRLLPIRLLRRRGPYRKGCRCPKSSDSMAAFRPCR